MKTAITSLVAAALIAAPAAADAASYKGKTSSGHPITFTVKNKRVHDLTGGIRMSCISIQGGGAPMGGSEVFGFRGSVPVRKHQSFKFMAKPAFGYRDVTMKNDLWLKRRGSGGVTGRMRLQYQFMISKYPIGTFSIYSCLGGATFKAKKRG